MRQRYRWLLRDEVAHTVENPADVEDEIRYLVRPSPPEPSNSDEKF